MSDPLTVSTPRPAAWPFTLLALGGGALAIGAIGLALTTLVGGLGDARTLAMLIPITLGVGGLVLGIGWSGLLVAGRAGFSPILGSFAVPATVIFGFIAGKDHDLRLVVAVVIVAGLFACAMAHYFALGERSWRRLGVARFGALLAVIGLGGEVFAVSRALDVPQAVAIVLASLAYLGLTLLGFGVALAPAVGRDESARA